jgi:membrane protein
VSFSSVFQIGKQTIEKWSDDHAATQAAAIAYYTAFSIAPMLLIAMAIAGAAFGEDAARGEVQRSLGRLIGDSGAAAVQDLINNTRKQRTGGWAALIGGIGLFLGATGVFVQLQETLNLVWKAPPAKEGMGIKSFIRKRVLSFAMVLGIGFLLLVSLVGSAVLSFVGSYVSGLLPGWEALLNIVNIVVAFGVTAGVFAAMFSYLPDKHVPWRYVWAPGIVTAGLFTLGKYVLGLYLGKSAVASSFGAAGSLAVVLVWVYYSAQIVLVGAELSYVLANPTPRSSAASPPASSG